jgi:hypothetical protein
MATRTSVVGTFATGDVLTEAHMDSLPAGWLGYIEDTTGQGSITTEASLTGLSLAVTLNASRRIEVRCCATVQTTVAGDSIIYRIKEGATVIKAFPQAVTAAGGPGALGVEFSRTITPTAGSHTYNVTLQRSSGSGTLTHVADAANVSFLRVMDVGPV